MIELESHADGTILPVKAHAGARRNAIGKVQAGALQVSVTQAPEKGKANKAIIAVLAEALGVRKSQIELIAGETSPQKRFLVRDVSIGELSNRIVTLISQTG
jgi:uncharacterized protein (TIGR00251 family)